MRVLTSRFQRVGELAYSLDGGTLYGCGPAWDVITLRPTFGFDHWNLGGGDESASTPVPKYVVRRLVPLPDGRVVVGGTDQGGQMELFKLISRSRKTDASLNVSGVNGHAAVLSPDARRLLIAGSSRKFGGQLLLDNFRVSKNKPLAQQWRQIPSEYTTAYPFALAFHPDGQRILSCERRRGSCVARWRATTDGALLNDLPVRLPVKTVHAAPSRCGGQLFVFEKRSVYRFDLVQPADLERAVPNAVANFGKRVTGLAVHPDGRRVYATSEDGTVREFDALTLQELRAWGWKVGKLLGVAVAPDGLTAAVGSDTGRVVVWDLE